MEHTYPYDLERQWLVERLETMSVKEKYQLAAAMLTTGCLEEVSGKAGEELLAEVLKMDQTKAMDSINCLLSLSDYEVLCPAAGYEKLGEYYLRFEAGLPRDILPYADLERIGTQYEDRHPGVFIGDCFVVLPQREPRQLYDGTNLDKLPDTDWSLRLKLASPAVPEGLWVCLPDNAIEEDGRLDEIGLTLRDLKVKTVQECRLLEVRCSLPELSVGLDEYQDVADLICDGNDLGFVLQERDQGKPRFLEKFRAVLEYEQCHSLKLALDIAANLNCYDFYPVRDAEQFGKEHLLQRQRTILEQDPVLRDAVDLAVYGEKMLEQQGYQLDLSETAYIRRNYQTFRYERTEPQPEFDITMQ